MEFVILTVSVLAAALLGWALAAAHYGRTLGQVQAQLTAVQATAAAGAQQLADALQNLQNTQQLWQQAQVEEGKLCAQLQAANTQYGRLEADFNRQTDQLNQLHLNLETARQNHHSAETAQQTAQAQNQALLGQLDEWRQRSAQLQQQLTDAHDKTDELKNALAEAGKKGQELATLNVESREQLQQIKNRLTQQEQATQQAQLECHKITLQHSELKTQLEQKETHFKEQLQHIQDSKLGLTQAFENLAHKIFEEKGKTFTQTSATSLDALLKPFREQIDGFQKRINEVHDSALQGHSHLNAEIKKVLDIGLHMSKEAHNLTTALKGDAQQRGAWGEAQLRRTLEMSGLIEDAHFEVQSSFKDADGKHKQTDYLIKLPDGKHMIIDSKVSLIAYDRVIAAVSPEEHALHLAEHIKAVRKHIDDLASKDYTNVVGMRSPNFVLMFMPIEPAYIEALKNNKDLFEYGYKKGVVLVSHTTLIPILRTVSNLWMLERSHLEAREVSEKAGDIYNQLCVVAERLSKVGGTLGTLTKHYNDAVVAVAGNQGLYGKVDRFNQLSIKVNKTLVDLPPLHIDVKDERLALIVQPVPEAGEP